MGEEFWRNVLMVLVWLPIGLAIRLAGVFVGSTAAAQDDPQRRYSANVVSMLLAVAVPAAAWLGAVLLTVWRFAGGQAQAGFGLLTGVLAFLPLGALYVWLMGNSTGTAKSGARRTPA